MIYKVVLTGGPAGGKSTAVVHLQERFEGLGYNVFVVPETATHIISGGISPLTMNDEQQYSFQKAILAMQMVTEKHFEEQANLLEGDSIIIYDRGLVDGKAFSRPHVWNKIMSIQDEIEIKSSRYDLVIHMITTAKGAVESYTTENNKSRHETAKQAEEADEKILNAWVGHPRLRVISNKGVDFRGKIKKVIKEIMDLIGQPLPIETERKFLVKVVGDIEVPHKETFHIVQYYLPVSEEDKAKGLEVRIRSRSKDGFTHYTMTRKTPVEGSVKSRHEVECNIKESEFYAILESNTNLRMTDKNRTCFAYKDHYIELDEYTPAMEDGLAIIEVETDDEEDIDFPPGIELIKEVTGDKKYSNYTLSQ